MDLAAYLADLGADFVDLEADLMDLGADLADFGVDLGGFGGFGGGRQLLVTDDRPIPVARPPLRRRPRQRLRRPAPGRSSSTPTWTSTT